jgi:hypothetical protein
MEAQLLQCRTTDVAHVVVFDSPQLFYDGANIVQ